MLVAKQGPLFIQLRKQQTGLFQARGLHKPIIRVLRSHILKLAVSGLTTWQSPAKQASKAIEHFEWMH